MVQEALTNVHKHARGAATTIRLAGDPGGGLVVEVVNVRPVAAEALLPGAGIGPGGAARARELAGGTLDAGPDAGRRVAQVRRVVPMAEVIRVLLVDDDPLVRAGLRMILSGADDLEVVGEAGDGAEAVTAVHAHRPDVVLMDIRMPGVDGLAATASVTALPDPPKVVVLTTFAVDEYVFRALEAGAAGFLLEGHPAPGPRRRRPGRGRGRRHAVAVRDPRP